MSNILWKNFHLCLSKIKCLPLSPSPPPSPPAPSNQDHNRPSPIPSTTTMIIKNYNTLYHDLTSDSTFSISNSADDDLFSSSSEDPDVSLDAGPPDFAVVFASNRFFFSSPGSSNSITDSLDSRHQLTAALVRGGVAVSTYSPDPYGDFRRSMQEMVESRECAAGDVKSDWEYLHELLLCYLSLNPKNTHKFIVGAFTDLLITLLSTSETNSYLRRSAAISRRLLL